MIVYNIQTNGPSSQMIVELLNDGAYIEPKAVAYFELVTYMKEKAKEIKNHIASLK